jgi:membrane protease YdiL (CAAX protease family)
VTAATIAKENLLPVEQAVFIVGLGLLWAFVIVYRRLLRGIRLRGGQVRSDLFGLPDTLVVLLLTVLVLLALVMQWLFPATAAGRDAMKDATSVLFVSLPVILALMIVRGISLPLVFGLRRVNPFRAFGVGVSLIVLLLPVITIVALIAYKILDGHAEQQEMVMKFREAAKTGKRDVIWQVTLTAALIAPLIEEFLFRGYFYPVLKRITGPVPAAIAISLFFGAIHYNAAGFPVLTVLALALTLAYEWSGSILVPIFMHACFNSVMLALMWWQTRAGVTP